MFFIILHKDIRKSPKYVIYLSVILVGDTHLFTFSGKNMSGVLFYRPPVLIVMGGAVQVYRVGYFRRSELTTCWSQTKAMLHLCIT